MPHQEGTTSITEPVVSGARWLAAMLVGLGIWVAASIVTAPILGSTAIGPVVGFVPVIFVAGRIVGARSVRRWMMVGLLAFGLVFALASALLIGFLLSLSEERAAVMRGSRHAMACRAARFTAAQSAHRVPDPRTSRGLWRQVAIATTHART